MEEHESHPKKRFVEESEIPKHCARFLRRMYEWVLHWAATPHGMAALIVLAFAESSFFPIPPDVLLIAMVASRPQIWWRAAAWTTIASVLGGIAGYAIGYFVWNATSDYFFGFVPGFSPPVFAKFQGWYDEWGVAIVLIAGFSPIPYKIFTIASGVAGLNFTAFIAASTVSRGARFFLVSMLLWKFGPPVRRFIERYFDILAVAFVVLLLLGFAVLGALGG